MHQVGQCVKQMLEFVRTDTPVTVRFAQADAHALVIPRSDSHGEGVLSVHCVCVGVCAFQGRDILLELCHSEACPDGQS